MISSCCCFSSFPCLKSPVGGDSCGGEARVLRVGEGDDEVLIISHNEEQQGRHTSCDTGSDAGSGNKASLSSPSSTPPRAASSVRVEAGRGCQRW